jgi:hypothetical protein
MPNYDPAVLANMLRMKSGSAYTPAEMMSMQNQPQQYMNQTTGAAITPAEMAAMQAQQQMAQQRMQQQGGASITPSELQYYQQFSGR